MSQGIESSVVNVAPTGGGGGSGITSLNGLTGASQTFANGTSGLSPNWASAGTVHTLNIPFASAVGVTAGLISKTDYDSFAAKQPAGNYITDLTGDATASGPGSAAITLATVATPGTFTKVTINEKGLVTSGTTLDSGDIPNNAANTTGTASNVTGVVAVANGGTGLSTLTANNVILGNGTGSPMFVAPGANGNLLTSDGTTWISAAPATNGTVASVAMTVPGFLSVAGSPITTTGTFAVTLATQTANTVFAGPATGAAAVPTFRTLVAADLPDITILTKAANYVIVSSDKGTYFKLDTSGGAFDLTLPTPVPGFRFKIIDSTGNFGANNLTLVRSGSELISGVAASKVFQTNWGGWEIFTDGTNWFVI